jgi:hypothetical protein
MNKVKMKRITTYKIPEDLNLAHQGIICPKQVTKILNDHETSKS